jgi:hypothetical protein
MRKYGWWRVTHLAKPRAPMGMWLWFGLGEWNSLTI